MRRLHTVLAVLLFFSAGLLAGEPDEVKYELPRPEWAWGAVGLRSIEGTLSKLALYCDRVATNSGAFMRLSIATWLFPVPLKDGLEKDGPAVVFLVDPGQVGGARNEKALILSVADAALLRESLEAVFGTDMKDGVMQVAVPRGFTEPDANLSIKLVPAGLLVAPTEAILKELEKLAGKKGAAGFIDPKGPDVVFEANIELLRRLQQRRLDSAFGKVSKAATVAAPSVAGHVTEGRQRLDDFLKKLDRLEIRVDVAAQEIRARACLRALADTELAIRWSALPKQPACTWTSWCDPDLAVFATGRFPAAWAYPEEEIAKWLVKYLPADSAQGRSAQAAVARELAALFAQLDGDLALAVRVDREGAWFPLTMFGGKKDGQADAGFEKLLTPVATLLAERIRLGFKLPADAPLPAVLERAGDGAQGIERHTVKFRNADVEAWAKRKYAGACGWPLELSARRAGDGLILAWGHGADACLDMEPAVRGDARDLLGELPGDAAGVALLRPATIMRLYLLQMKHVDLFNTTDILKGLTNTPARVYWGQGGGALQFEVRVPVEASRTILMGYFNYLKKDFDPTGDPADEDKAPEDAPAPKEVPTPKDQ